MFRMPKHIIVCSDGTGNTAIKGRGTNVFKLYESIDLHTHEHDRTLAQQVVLYDDGVGTGGIKPIKILSGAFGWGLGRNVRQLYAGIVRLYEPGDKLFLFGFSRGAFTVRTLAGLIIGCGVLDKRKFESDEDLRWHVWLAYREYRRRYRTAIAKLVRKPYTKERRELFKQRHSVAEESNSYAIEFVGVWDTVDAVGLPIPGVAEFINTAIYRFKFPDRALSPRVHRACHALSIDDERQSFEPMLWDEKGESSDRIKQVWFAGVHSNVGGGYPKQGMSIVPLYWMMAKAAESGLRFVDEDLKFYREHQNVNDKLYDSRAGLSVYYRYKPRDIAKLCQAAGTRPKVDMSVVDRIGHGIDGYAPGNIPGVSEIVNTDTWTSAKNVVAAVHAEKILNAAMGRHSLLDRVWILVMLRRAFHALFLASSFGAIGLVLHEESQRTGITSAVKRLFSGDLMWLLSGLIHLPWLASIIVVSYLVQRIAAGAMERRFSKFWHGLLSRKEGQVE